MLEGDRAYQGEAAGLVCQLENVLTQGSASRVARALCRPAPRVPRSLRSVAGQLTSIGCRLCA